MKIYLDSANIISDLADASIRHPGQVIAAAKAGAHVATVPFKVLEQMMAHPLTDSWLARFQADWEMANLVPRR